MAERGIYPGNHAQQARDGDCDPPVHLVRAFRAALDALALGVVIVTTEGRVVFANMSARSMIRDGMPIVLKCGRLYSASRSAKCKLHDAILKVAVRRSARAGHGVSLPLPYPDGRPALAHLLPLEARPVNSDHAPIATVIIFITPLRKPVQGKGTADFRRGSRESGSSPHHLPPARLQTACAEPPASLLGFSQLFCLTKAETRVLAAVMSGHKRADIADRLDIAPSTAKTHLERLYAKTGVRDLPALIQLVSQLIPPIANL